jgi:hypothetical protein
MPPVVGWTGGSQLPMPGSSSSTSTLQFRADELLAQVPHAAQWADRFIGDARTSATPARRFRRHVAPAIVHDAVQGVAQACVPDPDGMLRDLLVQAIDECAAWGPSRLEPRRRVRRRLVDAPVSAHWRVTAADTTTSNELREQALTVR